jgi:hypothetical protein
MENIKDYRERFFNLMESTIGDVKPLLSEQVKLEGRNVILNNDGTVTIYNQKNIPQKIKFSVESKIWNGPINVSQIYFVDGQYKIETIKGFKQDLTQQQVKDIINFVDTEQSRKDRRNNKIQISQIEVPNQGKIIMTKVK